MNHSRISRAQRPSEVRSFPAGRNTPHTDGLQLDAHAVLEALDEITACLRHYQAFGDRQELDESIFSLMALEARLQHSVQQQRKAL
ncbi:hypothetical protein ACJU26_13020 [Acidithiobacillus sp. M4-SHS-6]|uniref:hypothetical protein n=1 Tax=Acidithiobacillus sp. M4-SHS-6 TaxID=3383024 RepID=UPI0039BEAA7A